MVQMTVSLSRHLYLVVNISAACTTSICLCFAACLLCAMSNVHYEHCCTGIPIIQKPTANLLTSVTARILSFTGAGQGTSQRGQLYIGSSDHLSVAMHLHFEIVQKKNPAGSVLKLLAGGFYYSCWCCSLLKEMLAPARHFQGVFSQNTVVFQKRERRKASTFLLGVHTKQVEIISGHNTGHLLSNKNVLLLFSEDKCAGSVWVSPWHCCGKRRRLGGVLIFPIDAFTSYQSYFHLSCRKRAL